jgi:hypothetical protein
LSEWRIKSMIDKNSYLYYAANFEPEVARLFRAHDAKNAVAEKSFLDSTLATIASIVSASDISAAGREEWGVMRQLVEGYTSLDETTRKMVLAFGTPFSMRFALSR